jgi:hypothetical protein
MFLRQFQQLSFAGWQNCFRFLRIRVQYFQRIRISVKSQIIWQLLIRKAIFFLIQTNPKTHPEPLLPLKIISNK